MMLSGVISFLISLWMVKNRDKLALVDVPNARSSHDKPMPKGAGTGIVLGILAGLAGYYLAGQFPVRIRYIVIAAGFLAMASLGLLSDRFKLSALVRIILQALIASAVVYFMGVSTSLRIGPYNLDMGLVGILFAVLWVVSITNFYNFMDGIDGLAGMQALISGAGIAAFGVILGINILIPLGLILTGAAIGFLILNFPPGKIFMGDVGSYALGFYIACFALLDSRLLVPIALILGVFIFDTIITLARRILHKENWMRAHRSHFYQRATTLGYSHRAVTMTLSITSIVLTIMACVYLKVSGLFQLGIIVSAVLVLSGMALFIKFKERA